MKARIYFLFLLFITLGARAQEPVSDTINGSENDSIAFSTNLPEIVISNVKDSISEEQKKQLALLKRRVLKVYPFAKIAADRLTMLNQNLAALKSEKEKKKYSKIVQKYLEDEFEAQLKKLSRKEGQILVKLIYRQTGKLFQIDLKKTYSPATVAEDYMIEGYLRKAFMDRRLQKQDPAFKIDYEAITKVWEEKEKNN
jgi:hypothetical protein